MLVQELYFAVIRNRHNFSFPVKFFFSFCEQELLFAIVGAYQGQSLIHVTFAVKDDITKYAFIDIIFAIIYEGAFLLYLASVSSEIMNMYRRFSSRSCVNLRLIIPNK